MQPDLPNGKQTSLLVDVSLQIAILAETFSCPVVCEQLDFTLKKEQLREKGKRYARMLSSWCYSEFFKQLNSILSNRGITLVSRNPAFTSLIGLTKYSKQYGVGSDIVENQVEKRYYKLNQALLNKEYGRHLHDVVLPDS